jgi:hypothetical protein
VLTASGRLQAKLDLLLPLLGTPGRLLVEHPDACDLWPRYLAINAFLARETVPLLEEALARARELATEDAVSRDLVGYLEHHIPEEMHGDEPGSEALVDLAAVGVDPAEFRTRSLPPRIAELIEEQRSWIRERHPVAVLGYLAIEWYHPNVDDVEQLIEATGLPRAAFRQLLLHAELDVEHARDLRDVIDSLPLEPWQDELIGVSGLSTLSLLAAEALEIVTGRSASGAVSI